MKRVDWLMIPVGCLALAAMAVPPQVLHFPLHQFSISPLEARARAGTAVLLNMFLPPSGGFAPNVNVVAQPGPPSLDDYIAASKREFITNGLTLIQMRKLNDHTAVLEYSGNLQNRPLHFYAKASLKGGEVLLATATATEQQWPSASAPLRACVDTFQRDEDQSER